MKKGLSIALSLMMVFVVAVVLKDFKEGKVRYHKGQSFNIEGLQHSWLMESLGAKGVIEQGH